MESIYQGERLKEKMLDFYIQEREKGMHAVEAKYYAVHYITLFLLGLIEHYSEWEDLDSIKKALQNYRYLELYSYDSTSTQILEKAYEESKARKLLG